ncbi:MAG: VanZ family protein [Clostridium sp.]
MKINIENKKEKNQDVMKRYYILQVLKYCIISILIFGLLTYLNLQNGHESKNLTNTIYLKIFHLKPGYYLIIRKLFHFTYYFVYGYFIFQACYNYYKLKNVSNLCIKQFNYDLEPTEKNYLLLSEFKRNIQNKVYIWYIVIMFMLSVYCEFLQMYAIDRNPSTIDILINFAGALLMLIYIHIVFSLKRKLKK